MAPGIRVQWIAIAAAVVLSLWAATRVVRRDVEMGALDERVLGLQADLTNHYGANRMFEGEVGGAVNFIFNALIADGIVTQDSMGVRIPEP